ncbi:unnamed protein product [Cylindrotheca closterium]|uniref:Uncharacterized protein n=1 Tax=Cylindrotheca closterium TaxID=2856 RepID=A0AAD2G2U9_9STRA|nr:unnamed protein product [Cylindrotheca closterium]
MPLISEAPLAHDHSYHQEMKENSSTSEYSSETMPSSAQVLVQAAAYRIDLDPSKLSFLLHAMNEELVTELWQLQYMDFPSWRELGFPVGLIASIRALLEEEESSDHEEAANKNGAHRRAIASDNSTTELAVPKATWQQARMRASEQDNRGIKKRLSDITLSERFSFRTSIMSPPSSKPKSGSPAGSPMYFSVQSKSQKSEPRSNRIFMPVADIPPTSPPRRSSSRSKVRSPMQPSSRDQHQEKTEEQRRRSSFEMPLRPSRRPTITDLESLFQGIGEKYLASSSDSVGGSMTSTSGGTSIEASLALESLLRSGESEENKDVREKSMDTIITGNLRGTADQDDLGFLYAEDFEA